MTDLSRDGDDDHPLSEINVIPFLDIMLVLLIVFMAALPAVENSIRLRLPTVQTSKSATQIKSIRLSLTEQGQLYWNQQLIDKDTLLRYLPTVNAKETGFDVAVDRQVSYESLAEILAILQNNGIQKIQLLTADAKSPKAL